MAMFPAPLRRLLLALLGGALACLGWLVLSPTTPVAAATTYTVTSTTDSGGVAGTPGDLRFAITQVNAGTGTGDTITITAAGTIILGSALPALTKNVAITGPTSGAGIVIDGGCTVNGSGVCQSGTGVTVFTVNSGVTVNLSNLTIQHGNRAAGAGAGIDNEGGTLSVTNCTLAANNSSASGGGIYNNSGTLSVTNSTLSANSAAFGGGIYTLGGTVTLTNSTLSGNSASVNGGGMYNNTTVTVTNTIVAGNSATSRGPDVFGAVSSGGHNLIGKTDDSTGFTGMGDQTGTGASPLNALLGPLGPAGGPTPTIPLLAGSPAIRATPFFKCTLTTDQRGLPRSTTTGSCSIGAFEPQTATYTVGSRGDTGAMALFSACQTAANTTCKLRDALTYAASGSDTINFNSGGSGQITLANGTLTLAAGVTIAGPTSGTGVTVDGGCMGCDPNGAPSGGVTVFLVNGVTANLSNLTIQHGNASVTDSVTATICGGGIFNKGGTLTVTNSTLRSNVVAATSTGDGGALFTQGGLVVIQSSTISGNRTLHSRGAGIFTNAGNVTLTNSTLSGNSAFGFGGGIYTNGGTLAVANSTFSGNSSGGSGGGIENGGTLSIVNGTLSGNSATGGFGGGIDSSGNGASATLTNTIVAGNTATINGNPSNSPDLKGTITSGGHNLIGDTGGSTGIADGTNHDIVNNTSLLGTLGSDGGPTQTIPLLVGSPAIGHGDITANGCASATVNHKDQRGFPRAANRCAIGAFEPQTATYTVGSLSDTGAMATFAACQTPGDPTCKLRDAIAYASSGSDTVTFNTGLSGTITLAGGTLTLVTSVTITGLTSGGIVADGGCMGSCNTTNATGGVTVFYVNGGVTASVSNLTIQHGNGGLGGGSGGIANLGMLTVTGCTFTANAAINGVGGGIFNGGTGTLTVTDSTFTANAANNGGGGIANFGMLTVTNSTFSGNSTTAVGGGGIYNGGTAILTNTIVAGNTATNFGGPDLKGTITSGGHNLIGNTSGSSGITNGTNGDLVNNTPLLGTLGANGGTTQTVALLTGSPAIAHGDPAICTQTGAGNVNTLDQRGITRPTGLCAIGAFEPLLSAISPPSGSVSGGGTVTLTGAGYAAGASVTIGNVPCTNVQIATSTTLTCTTGAHGAGAVDVVVTVSSQTGTLTGGYTYGVVSPLPPPQSPGPTGGPPASLPVSRPTGPTAGTAPSPLPSPRP
jgi:hypothetical protein